jgi:hypothetical protein
VVNVKVTPDNARKLWAGMTRAQAEEVLGEGQACTLNELGDVTTAAYGSSRALLFGPAPPPGIDSWVR